MSSSLVQNFQVIWWETARCCCRIKICKFTKNKQGVSQCFHLPVTSVCASTTYGSARMSKWKNTVLGEIVLTNPKLTHSIIDILSSSWKIAVWWMPQNPIDDKSTLFKVMGWCCQQCLKLSQKSCLVLMPWISIINIKQKKNYPKVWCLAARSSFKGQPRIATNFRIPWICYERNFSEFYLSIWNQLVFNQRLQLFVQLRQPYLFVYAWRK